MLKQLHEIEDYFFTQISKSKLAFESDITVYKTNLDSSNLNFVYIKNTQYKNLKKIIESIVKFFKKDNLGFSLIVEERLCSEDFINLLKEFKFEEDENTEMMKLNLQQFNCSEFRNKEISICSTDLKLDDWIIPLKSAFGNDDLTAESYLKLHEKAILRKAKLKHYTLYLEGRPVSSITLTLHNNLARLDDIGTIVDFQRNGFATILINYALNIAKNYGISKCYLEASKSGMKLYEKIGFEKLKSNRIFQLNTCS